MAPPQRMSSWSLKFKAWFFWKKERLPYGATSGWLHTAMCQKVGAEEVEDATSEGFEFYFF